MLSFSIGNAFGQAPPTGCPQPDPDSLFKKLTSIKVAGIQVIKDEDARGVSDELAAAVRCNAFAAASAGARQEAKKVILPIAAVAETGAVVAVVGAFVAVGRREQRETRAASAAAAFQGFRQAGRRRRR